MKPFNIKYKSSRTEIISGNGICFSCGRIPRKNTVIVCDLKVYKLYGNYFPDFPIIKIRAGEDSKTMASLEYIYKKLLEFGADRSTFLLGIGGGIICDLVGFAASTYFRGLDFGFVPTSLLAMSDAAIGGKNGCNFMGYKNIIGTFKQPRFVIIDTTFLGTLPKKEMRNGFAEIIKSSLISSERLFRKLENIKSPPDSSQTKILEQIIVNAVKIKAGIVKKDEKEGGLRKILNLGHTLGHALESTTRISHGRAIAIGTMFASGLSLKKGLIAMEDFERIKAVFRSFGLLHKIGIDGKALFDALIRDKKKYGDSIDFILLNGIGKALIRPITIKTIKKEVLIFSENNL